MVLKYVGFVAHFNYYLKVAHKLTMTNAIELISINNNTTGARRKKVDHLTELFFDFFI